MGQLVGAIQGMGEACRALEFPVVSGNVSLYNETAGHAIQPVPAVGGVGLIANLDRMAVARFDEPDAAIIVIGETRGHIGQSMFLREILGREDGETPPVDLAVERRNGNFVRTLISEGMVRHCHDVSDGGLLVAIAEMALAGNVGATVELPTYANPLTWGLWRGPGPLRHCRARGRNRRRSDPGLGHGRADHARGHHGGDMLTVTGVGSISLEELRQAHEGWLPNYMAAR